MNFLTLTCFRKYGMHFLLFSGSINLSLHKIFGASTRLPTKDLLCSGVILIKVFSLRRDNFILFFFNAKFFRLLKLLLLSFFRIGGLLLLTCRTSILLSSCWDGKAGRSKTLNNCHSIGYSSYALSSWQGSLWQRIVVVFFVSKDLFLKLLKLMGVLLPRGKLLL